MISNVNLRSVFLERSARRWQNLPCAVVEPLIRDISDTARWVAVYRARESERPDAVFRDPYARALAGERGEQIANALPLAQENAWAWTTRTQLFDCHVSQQIAAGAGMVVNLAAVRG